MKLKQREIFDNLATCLVNIIALEKFFVYSNGLDDNGVVVLQIFVAREFSPWNI